MQGDGGSQWGATVAVWQPVPPAGAGKAQTLRYAGASRTFACSCYAQCSPLTRQRLLRPASQRKHVAGAAVQEGCIWSSAQRAQRTQRAQRSAHQRRERRSLWATLDQLIRRKLLQQAAELLQVCRAYRRRPARGVALHVTEARLRVRRLRGRAPHVGNVPQYAGQVACAAGLDARHGGQHTVAQPGQHEWPAAALVWAEVFIPLSQACIQLGIYLQQEGGGAERDCSHCRAASRQRSVLAGGGSRRWGVLSCGSHTASTASR